METKNLPTVTSLQSSNSSISYCAPDALPPENPANSLACHVPAPGTVIPNRIFVGGIDYKVNENDLQQIFSQHGAVKEVKIVIDRSGMSKGYGFVTFETQEDVLKILRNVNGISFNDKKLCIGQAVKKHQTSGLSKNDRMTSLDPHQMRFGTFFFTTSTGYPYTYHNGVAYFHCPNRNPLPQHWSAAPQLMLSHSHQPVHHQQLVYHHCQNVPNQYLYNTVQVPMSSAAVMYSQYSEYLYEPSDGGSFLPPAPGIEDVTLEQFVESHDVYSGVMPVVLQHGPAKNQMFPSSQVYLKPKYQHYLPPKDFYHLPEAAESPEDSMFHSFQPLM